MIWYSCRTYRDGMVQEEVSAIYSYYCTVGTSHNPGDLSQALPALPPLSFSQGKLVRLLKDCRVIMH